MRNSGGNPDGFLFIQRKRPVYQRFDGSFIQTNPQDLHHHFSFLIPNFSFYARRNQRARLGDGPFDGFVRERVVYFARHRLAVSRPYFSARET